MLSAATTRESVSLVLAPLAFGAFGFAIDVATPGHDGCPRYAGGPADEEPINAATALEVLGRTNRENQPEVSSVDTGSQAAAGSPTQVPSAMLPFRRAVLPHAHEGSTQGNEDGCSTELAVREEPVVDVNPAIARLQQMSTIMSTSGKGHSHGTLVAKTSRYVGEVLDRLQHGQAMEEWNDVTKY